jgi:hypothetical protein
MNAKIAKLKCVGFGFLDICVADREEIVTLIAFESYLAVVAMQERWRDAFFCFWPRRTCQKQTAIL